MILLDLFSGIGGFHLGLKMAGFEFEKVYWSEVDEYASKVYRKRFPNGIELGDVTRITGEEILGNSKFVWQSQPEGSECNKRGWPSNSGFFLCAGFPCQDISTAGKQAGLEGSRSGLFFEIIRLVKALSPRIVFLENVANLLNSNQGTDFGTVLRSLAEVGYDAEWHCVPASYVGANHRRDRIWIVAYPKCRGRGKQVRINASQGSFFKTERRKGASWVRPSGENVSHPQAVRLQGDRAGGKQEPGSRQPKGEPQGRPKALANSKRERTGCGDVRGNGSLRNAEREMQRQDRIKADECGGWWSTEPSVGRVAHGIPKRVDRLKGLGNSVVPQCVAYIAEIMIKPILDKNQKENQ